jgi:hypothetical protein
MADKRYLRSPIYISNIQTAGISSSCTIEIDGTVRYILSKDSVQEGSTYRGTYEISELCRDYLDTTFNGTYTSKKIEVEITVQFYAATGGGGGTIGNAYVTTFNGVDGYTYFTEGSNVVVTGTQAAQSNTEVFLPENTSGYIPSLGTANILYNSVTSTATSKTVNGTVFKINRICSSKYTPYKVTFVNKFGAFQDIYFFMKRTDTTNVARERYKSAQIDASGDYNTYVHSNQTFNVISRDVLTMSTGLVNEGLNVALEEMLFSEQVHIYQNSQYLPIIPQVNTLSKKTRLNDKLVEYTMAFEFAFDKINNIR